MSDDERMAALMSECLAGLTSNEPTAAQAVRRALNEIEAMAPGEVEAMASRLQLHRLGLRTTH